MKSIEDVRNSMNKFLKKQKKDIEKGFCLQENLMICNETILKKYIKRSYDLKQICSK